MIADAAERRRRLVLQAELQRVELARSFMPWRAVLTRTGQVVAAVRSVRDHPGVLVGGLVLIAALRPGPVGRWLRRGLILWQVLGRLHLPDSPSRSRWNPVRRSAFSTINQRSSCL